MVKITVFLSLWQQREEITKNMITLELIQLKTADAGSRVHFPMLAHHDAILEKCFQLQIQLSLIEPSFLSR